jgi:hypothetical protein
VTKLPFIPEGSLLMTFNHNAQIATQDTTDPDMKLVVPELGGEFVIHLTDESHLYITLKQGFVWDGALYPMSGSMNKHEDTWKFWGPEVNIPKLSPKRRVEVLLLLTDRINQYLTDHPEIFEHYRARAWERGVREQQYQIRQKQAHLVRDQAYIEQSQRGLEERRVQLVEMQEAYEKLLADKPKGAIVPEEKNDA